MNRQRPTANRHAAASAVRRRVLSALLLLAALAYPRVAAAQDVPIAYVASGGSPLFCGFTTPCSSLAYALAVVNAGGEIVLLDSMIQAQVTITKSVTIRGNANAVLNGVVITANNITVSIKDVTIQGAGTGAIGLRMWSNAKLTLDNVRIAGFLFGLHIDAGNAVVNRSFIENNSVSGVSAAAGSITLEGSVVTRNGVGIQALGASSIQLSDDAIHNNGTNIACGGAVLSFGNNRISDGAGCGPTLNVPMQ